MRAITRIGAALAGLGVLAGCAVTYPGPNLGSPVSTSRIVAMSFCEPRS